MAGNEDRNRIGPVGGGYCAHGFGASQFSRQFAVGNGFAVRDILQFSPHRVLEIRSGKYQGNVECGSFPGEIFVELGDRPLDRIRSAVFVNGVQGMSYSPVIDVSAVFVRPISDAQLAIEGTDEQLPYRRKVAFDPDSVHVFVFKSLYSDLR